MATSPFKILILVTFFFSILLSFPTAVSSISTTDLDSLLTVMRINGHALFANAISTSDLLFEILSLPSVTLLAPTDPSVFALDMLQTPPFYLSNLRLHVIPLRLSWINILRLSNGSSIPTSLPSHHLNIFRRRVPGGHAHSFVVGDNGGGEGAEVVMPGLYYTRYVAVHGLAGILTLRSRIANDSSPPPVPTNSPNSATVFPPVPMFPPPPTVFSSGAPKINSSPVNHTAVPPVPRIPDNNTSCPVSSPGPFPPQVAENQTVLAPRSTVPPPTQGPTVHPSEDGGTSTGSYYGLVFSPEKSPAPGPMGPMKD